MNCAPAPWGRSIGRRMLILKVPTDWNRYQPGGRAATRRGRPLGFGRTGALRIAVSDLAHGLESGPRMDLALAHDRGLAAEAFDDRADIGADRAAGQQHRRVARQRG